MEGEKRGEGVGSTKPIILVDVHERRLLEEPPLIHFTQIFLLFAQLASFSWAIIQVAEQGLGQPLRILFFSIQGILEVLMSHQANICLSPCFPTPRH